MKMNDRWRIDYVRYRNPEFADWAWAGSRREAERIASGLRKLKHVSDIRVTKVRTASRR